MRVALSPAGAQRQSDLRTGQMASEPAHVRVGQPQAGLGGAVSDHAQRHLRRPGRAGPRRLLPD